MNYAVNLVLIAIPLLATIISFGLGLFVFLRNPRHPANIGFGLGMLSLALIEGGDGLFILSNSGMVSMIGKRISLAGNAFLPSTWFLFSLTFARADYKAIVSRWWPVLSALYLGSIFFLFWINSPLLISPWGISEISTIISIGPVGRYFYIFLLLGMIINIIHLENTLRFSS